MSLPSISCGPARDLMDKQNQFSEEMANALKQIAELTSQIKEMNETAVRNTRTMERLTRIMLILAAGTLPIGILDVVISTMALQNTMLHVAMLVFYIVATFFAITAIILSFRN